MRFVRFAVRTVIGAALTWVWVVQQNETDFFLITLVCTGGGSLVLWIPLWWTIGTVVVAAVNGLKRVAGLEPKVSGEQRVDKPEEKHRVEADVETVRALQFIRLARQQGRSVAEIRENMLRAGWQPAEVVALLARGD